MTVASAIRSPNWKAAAEKGRRHRRACGVFPTYALLLIAAVSFVHPTQVAAQSATPFDGLLFKCTHNSYQCHYDTPDMEHLVNQQIDDFGVWGLELDVGFVNVGGQLLAVVGHTGPGDGNCLDVRDLYPDLDPNALEGYLRMIRDSKVFAGGYRPVILFFDWKFPDWGAPCPGGDCDAAGRQACEAVFGPGSTLTWDQARTLSLPELRGRIVLGAPQRYDPDCTDLASVAAWFDDPTLRCYRIDQYQSDWTFELGVPPNPIVLDAAASPPWTVTDAIGDDWVCPPWPATPTDFSSGQIVGEHGTYRFPYRTLGAALTRLLGTTAVTGGAPDSRRAGRGWTVLARPGDYSEHVTLSAPLVLKNAAPGVGLVVIGR